MFPGEVELLFECPRVWRRDKEGRIGQKSTLLFYEDIVLRGNAKKKKFKKSEITFK